MVGRHDDEMWADIQGFFDGHAGSDTKLSCFVAGCDDDTPYLLSFDEVLFEAAFGIVEDGWSEGSMGVLDILDLSLSIAIEDERIAPAAYRCRDVAKERIFDAFGGNEKRIEIEMDFHFISFLLEC